MALSTEEKKLLNTLREALQLKQSQPQFLDFTKLIGEVDLGYISAEELKAFSDPVFTVGIDFKAIDTTPPFTSTDMNTIAPGALNVRDLKTILTNKSLVQSATTEIIKTQQGELVLKKQVLINGDIEDLVETKTKSQGTNLQFINDAQTISAETTNTQAIKSKFVENK